MRVLASFFYVLLKMCYINGYCVAFFALALKLDMLKTDPKYE